MAALDPEALQTELKKKRICRFCLCQDPSKISNIYMRDTRIKSSAPLPIQIMAIASIEVFSNDGMPSFVCADCTNMFEYSYQFKQMCKKADNLLRQFPLTGKWPECLEKPILKTSPPPYPIGSGLGKNSKATQVRTPLLNKLPVKQDTQLLPRKILNSSVSSKGTVKTTVVATAIADSLPQSDLNTNLVPKIERAEEDYNMTLFDKIDNNVELSLDDIQQLVATQDGSEMEFIAVDNLAPVALDPKQRNTKPKLLNKSSIRILNKNADPESEPRLSLPKIKKDVSGKTEIVAEILNVDDKYEEEPDPKNAAPIETNVFPCNFCDRTFPLLQLRDLHIKNHSRDRKFQCEHCEKSFFSKYDLQRHSFIHNGEKPFKCSVCDKAFSRSSLLTRHEKSHTDVPKHICIHCERSFLSKDDLEKHVEKHNINRPFVCKICNKGFAFKQGLERHEVVHSRQQPYSCQYCDRSFSTTTKLSRHLTAHAGLRPYPCKFCKRSYLLSHHLTRHLRSHKNANDPVNFISFTCMRCNTSFDSRDELIRHSTTHANETNLACPLCKDVFDTMLLLTSHIQDHSEGEAYACEFCDLIFLTADKLQLHTDTDHSQEMEAYHADDRVQADKKRQEDALKKDNTANITDEKLQHTVNEFMCDELSNEGNDSHNPMNKNVNNEKESPKIINHIIIKSAVVNANDGNQIEHKSLLIPLKQRKIDVAGKSVVTESKTLEQTKQSPQLRRKIPNATGVASNTNQSKNQSLLKLPKSATVTETTSTLPSNATPAKTPPSKAPPSKAPPSKAPPSKAPPSKTPPSNASSLKKPTTVNSMPIPKIIKVENEPNASSVSSSPVDNNDIAKRKIDTKKIKVQKITVTKAQAAAMAKEGRIKIKDGRIILKKSMSTSPAK